jgi:CBS domain-containing protein
LAKSESTEAKSIENMMSKRLITIGADSSAFDAAKQMSENMISSIIVTDNDKIVGKVCATDLQASKTPLASIMSAPLITVDKDSTVEHAANTMIKNKVRHLGVTASNENNPEIIAIVSSRDIVRLYLHALEKHENMLTNQLIDKYYWQEEPMEEINS